MKSTLVFALSLATFGLPAVAQQPPRVAVEISTPTPVAKAGAEIRIDVKVTNESDGTIWLMKALGPDGQAESANGVEVYDGLGKRLPWAVDHPMIWSSRKGIRVAPGKSENDFLILSKLFDMNAPGKYTVIVRQELPPMDSASGKDTIYVPSKPLTITVTE